MTPHLTAPGCAEKTKPKSKIAATPPSELSRSYSPSESTTFKLRQRGSITVWLTFCLTGLDSTKLVNLYLIQHKQSNRILTSQTGGQSYSDTSPYEVSECSLGIFIPEYCAGFGRLAFLQRRNCGPPWSQCWSAGCAPWDVVGLPARVRRQSEDLRRHN